MNGFVNFLLHFIFIATFSFLFFMSIFILRPLRVHRTRPLSTMSLKISYLLFLFTFIALSYMILFFTDLTTEGTLDPDQTVETMSFIVLGTAFFVPNLAIMLRRKVKSGRRAYNVFFTFVNLLFAGAMLALYYFLPFNFR
jgi:uncharacterized membrane protein YhaH (DUF805 family)